MENIITKTCIRCDKDQPLTNFDKQNKKGQLRADCKECRKATNRLYYLKRKTISFESL